MFLILKKYGIWMYIMYYLFKEIEMVMSTQPSLLYPVPIFTWVIPKSFIPS